MKKIIFLIIVTTFIACKKNQTSGTNSNSQAYFNFKTSRAPLGSSMDIRGASNVLNCLYYSGSPSAGYLFEFITNIGDNQGIHFVIPTLQSGTYNYSASLSGVMSNECVIFDGFYDTVKGTDSAKITINISRYSNGTMDGTFTMNIWDLGFQSAGITNGTFADIPLIKN